jgi:acyl transferase domain-containing protein/pimeloyl-ACP methyl ester carboxylesterase/NADPH:quinone reductase-like Zn-dependent oxidoreductase/NAD(P)-dependent dehydrogenase (short-subunit alcohol dehydrogenase family)/acyl carrier protein
MNASIKSVPSVEPVAIVGIGCRLPGGIASPNDLLSFLLAHGDGVVDVPSDRWSTELFYDPNPEAPGKAYVRRGSFLRQNVFDFDPAPFGISPREADRLDPQQRLLLEVTWEALEDAATPIERIRGSNTSVFVGGFTLDHQNLVYSEQNRRLIDAHTAIGASLTILSNRISYTFDLQGPSMTVDTACSSSLVATHLGYRSVAHDGCELAIVGGVNVMVSPATTIAMCKGHFLAPDGRSKSFEATADGYGRGEGAGVVILKRLSSALRDKNRIYAVIRATGVNQDGRTEAMPVPSEPAQRRLADVVRQQAGLAPGDIAYVEAHGTGTAAGDPVEARALGSVYGRERSTPLRIGSLKTNIGHLEAASGVAGLIKATLSVYTRTIFPQRAFETPNAGIPFEALGLKVAAAAEPWPLPIAANAAVNSFGYGGTNAHVVLSEWRLPEGQLVDAVPADPAVERGLKVVPVSAATQQALSAQASLLSTGETGPIWHDQAYTLARHRSHLAERLVVLASSGEELAASLSKFARGEIPAECVVGRAAVERKVLWVFTGMGPQWFAMGRQLYEQEPAFRAAVDEADAAFARVAGFSILGEMQRDEAASGMRSNRIAQPANLVLQVGLVSLLRTLGVPCHGVLGHSVGELAAAWAAGCLSLEQSALVAYHRSRIQQKAAGQGTMLAAGIGPAEAGALLRDVGGATIASYNSPKSVTFAGERAALELLARRLAERQAFHRMMTVEVAYHSPQMDPFQREFLDAFAGLTPRAPEVPLYSTVRATRQDGAIHDAEYFWQNARLPVMLQPAIGAALEDGYSAFLEIGPHPVLAGAIREMLDDRGKDGQTFCCLRRKQPEQATLLRAVGELHVAGVPIDFAKLFPTGTARELPHYPFQRSRHWVESGASHDLLKGGEQASPILSRKDRGPSKRYQCDLARPALRYLEDHRVQGTVVFPAAGYVEAALAASVDLRGPDDAQSLHVLEDFKFERALVLRPTAGPELLVDVDDGMVIRFFARHAEDPWEQPAKVRLLPRARFDIRTLDVASLRAAHTEQQETRGLYERFAALGLEYGPRFRALHEVSVRRESVLESAVLARLRPLEPDERSVSVHPTLLDAGFQALLSLVPDPTQPLLPVSVDQLRWTGKSRSPAWAYGRVRMSGEDELTADLALASEHGEVLMDVRGLVCRAVDRRSRTGSKTQPRYFHRDTWEKAAWSPPPWTGGRTWALAGTAQRFAAALADSLAAKGVHVATMDGDAPEAVAGCDTLVFGAAHDPADLASVDTCSRLLAAAKAARAAGASLRVVTFGAHAVLAEESADPTQAALSGLSRVVMTEWPELGCRVLDLDAATSTSIDSVAAVLAADEAEEEIALRGTGLYVRRLLRDESLATVPDRLVSGHDYAGAFTLKRDGDDALEYVASDRRAPGQGEIEVLVVAALVDGRRSTSNAPIPARRTGSVRTESVAGRILRCGAGVSDLQEGELVHVLSPGEIGSHVVAPAFRATRVLSRHSPAEATAYGPYFAAWHALCVVGRLERGDVLLVNGASTALGLAAVKIGRMRGARVVATVLGGASREALLANGVLAVELADGLDAATTLRDAAGRVDVVLNTLTGLPRDRATLALRPGGCFLDLVKPDGAEHAPSFGQAADRGLTYAALDLAQLSGQCPERYASVAHEVLDALASGRLDLLESKVVLARDLGSILALADTASPTLDLSERDISIRERRAERPLLRADRSYLVTGGLTGFGLATAEWLVSEGARNVVLGSRRGRIEAEASPAIDRMRERGASVSAIKLDVSNQASVERAVADIRATMPPLAGVFHSAAVLEDRPIADVDSASLERVLGAKALGAWFLHEATRTIELDFFVLFSSVSALVGNAHQATYVAASAWLDALASTRRALGLRATSVSWGALGDVGLLARDGATEAHLRGLGFTPIPASQALSALKVALLQDCDKIGIIDANWDKWIASFPNTPWNRLERLREESAADPFARLRAELAPLSGEAKKKHVQGRVAAQAASVLRTDATRLDVGLAFRDLGLDSIMAVELQVALETALGLSVPTIELLGASVVTIVQRTLDRSQDARGGMSIRPPSMRPPPSQAADLRAAFLARIGLQPPYFALSDMAVRGEFVEATASLVVPSEYEDEPLSMAEAARHLESLGQCALSLKCPIPGKVIYPASRAQFEIKNPPEGAPAGSRIESRGRVRLRARCTGFDLRASKAFAETELLDSEGNPIVALNVEYHVVPHEQFAVLFRNRGEPTHEQSGFDPYLSWRAPPRVEYKEGVATVDLGTVSPEDCLGHFVGYPTLSAAMMARDALRLVADGVTHEHGWEKARVTLVRGTVTTSTFIFAHEPVAMSASRVGESEGVGREVWRCAVYAGAQRAAQFECEVLAHEAHAFEGARASDDAPVYESATIPTSRGHSSLSAFEEIRVLEDGRSACASLRWAEEGRRDPTLLLLHGVGCNHHYFAPLAERLGRHDLLIPSLPGRCGSDGPPLSTVAQAARWVYDFLADVNLPVVAVGHSYGGVIAMELANLQAALPVERRNVRGLVLIGTPRLPLDPKVTDLYASQREAAPTTDRALSFLQNSASAHASDAVLRQSARAMSLTPMTTSASDVAAVTDAERRNALPRAIHLPTLVIVGSEDRLAAPRYARYLTRHIPQSRLVVLDGVGHHPPLEATEQVAEHILSFLDAFELPDGATAAKHSYVRELAKGKKARSG